MEWKWNGMEWNGMEWNGMDWHHCAPSATSAALVPPAVTCLISTHPTATTGTADPPLLPSPVSPGHPESTLSL